MRIDALGIHEIGLYPSDNALDGLLGWLPQGAPADPGAAVDANALLASSDRSALVTLTQFTTQGSAEIASASSDLILARHGGRLHVFGRHPDNAARLVPRPMGGKDVRETLADLLA